MANYLTPNDISSRQASPSASRLSAPPSPGVITNVSINTYTDATQDTLDTETAKKDMFQDSDEENEKLAKVERRRRAKLDAIHKQRGMYRTTTDIKADHGKAGGTRKMLDCLALKCARHYALVHPCKPGQKVYLSIDDEGAPVTAASSSVIIWHHFRDMTLALPVQNDRPYPDIGIREYSSSHLVECQTIDNLKRIELLVHSKQMSDRCKIKTIPLPDGEEICTSMMSHSFEHMVVGVSGSGLDHGYALRVINHKVSQMVMRIPMEAKPEDLCFVKEKFACAAGNEVHLFDLDNPSSTPENSFVHPNGCVVLKLHHLAELLFTGCSDGSVYVWNLNDRPTKRLRNPLHILRPPQPTRVKHIASVHGEPMIAVAYGPFYADPEDAKRFKDQRKPSVSPISPRHTEPATPVNKDEALRIPPRIAIWNVGEERKKKPNMITCIDTTTTPTQLESISGCLVFSSVNGLYMVYLSEEKEWHYVSKLLDDCIDNFAIAGDKLYVVRSTTDGRPNISLFSPCTPVPGKGGRVEAEGNKEEQS